MKQPVPARPKIFHITHVDNLEAIVEEGGLLADRVMREASREFTSIGMTHNKNRRLEELSIGCHPGTHVGDYVPFNFCPRSVMLYVIHRANHPQLGYRGGQGPIVHLQADLRDAVAWAEGEGRRWALAQSNAASRYCEFGASLDDLGILDWDAIMATDFRAGLVQDRKQAEFLCYERFPFHLVEAIGVESCSTRDRARTSLRKLTKSPPVQVRPAWYF